MLEERLTDDGRIEGWEWGLEIEKEKERGILKNLRVDIEELEFKIRKLSPVENFITSMTVRGGIKEADSEEVLSQHREEMKSLEKEKKEKKRELRKKEIEIVYLDVKLKFLKELANVRKKREKI